MNTKDINAEGEESKLKSLFDEALKRRGMMLKDFAKEMGMTRTGIYLALSSGSIKFAKLKQMAKILGVSVAYFDPEHHSIIGNVILYDKPKSRQISDPQDSRLFYVESKAHCELMARELDKREKDLDNPIRFL